MDNVVYDGAHSVTFITEDGKSYNTWTDWGLVPSSRHSEPRNGVWSNAASIPGINGANDLVRLYTGNVINSTPGMLAAMKNDNRDAILNDTDHKYDLYQTSSGSLSFYIADQKESFFAKQQKLLKILHNKKFMMQLADDPGTRFDVRTTVESMSSGSSFSTITIGYTVLNGNSVL